MKTQNEHRERAVQHLFPLELSCDVDAAAAEDQTKPLNLKAYEYKPQLRQKAVVAALQRMQDMARQENDEH